MFERFYDQRLRAQEEDGRTSWTIALAHGAGLVTLGGLIGNVEDVNYAVAQLWPALTCFGAGLAFSVASVQRHAVVVAVQLGVTVIEGRREKIVEQRGTRPTDVFAPLDLSGARHVFGTEEAAVQAYLSFVKGSIERDQTREAELDTAFAASELELREKVSEWAKEKNLFIKLQSIAIGCAFAAAAALAFAGLHGLQPKSKPAAEPARKVVSAPLAVPNSAATPSLRPKGPTPSTPIAPAK
ncbi:hypothetical protein [Caulobacter sp.]|uniref:hypothetical protein n=1 Tax=Caulobacter sp. TaxID=78 RepID=UPI001B0037D4|nr:hypothetical protein [Caulobacter sp.]MBO9546544.1 hypothetical protein [Caulobacter sp.]